ncbi:hypothetical protein PsYK624_105250 [Phanerochaete sordida]|uniref:DUF6697 domain-containing protein n=1 Tax=Phanerochaete sordida TaxID=48140 RepID=A0A9P3GG69_9APHY|nr:hypothetical protein PsYK624_105250 [Phanerochaete sordida]
MTDEQIQDALAGLKNSDAKIKKEFTFSDRILYRRLQKIGREIYPVDDSVNKYFLFSRYYFSNRYGGSFVATFPTMSEEKLQEHGLDDWAFPSLEYNPHAPQVPGAPGMFYVPDGHASGSWVSKVFRKRDSSTNRVFVRLDGGKWLYVGTYVFAPIESLTPAEFMDQPEEVKRTWAREIKSHSTWGNDVLARIYFRRRNGTEPTETELQQISANRSALNSVSEDEVVAAYSAGEEEFGVFSMTCTGYEADWIAELVADYPKWLKSRSKSSSKRKTATRTSQRKAKAVAPRVEIGPRMVTRAGAKRKVDKLGSE